MYTVNVSLDNKVQQIAKLKARTAPNAEKGGKQRPNRWHCVSGDNECLFHYLYELTSWQIPPQ